MWLKPGETWTHNLSSLFMHYNGLFIVNRVWCKSILRRRHVWKVCDDREHCMHCRLPDKNDMRLIHSPLIATNNPPRKRGGLESGQWRCELQSWQWRRLVYRECFLMVHSSYFISKVPKLSRIVIRESRKCWKEDHANSRNPCKIYLFSCHMRFGERRRSSRETTQYPRFPKVNSRYEGHSHAPPSPRSSSSSWPWLLTTTIPQSTYRQG